MMGRSAQRGHKWPRVPTLIGREHISKRVPGGQENADGRRGPGKQEDTERFTTRALSGQEGAE